MRNIDDYQLFTASVWVSEGKREQDAIAALGLAGETGEAVEHIKKLYRDGKWNEEDFIKEMGDVIYYWARLLDIKGIPASKVLSVNMEKLNKRKQKNTIQGSGNYR